MRTVHDLEAAFADLADTASDPDLLSIPTSATRRSDARPRGLAPAGAALATVAVIGGIVLATSGSDSKQTSGSNPRAASRSTVNPQSNGDQYAVPAIRGPKGNATPDLTFRFTAQAPAGANTSPSYGIDRAGQVLTFGDAEVTLHYVDLTTDRDEAGFDAAKIIDRHPVRINGQDGFYGRIPGLAGGERLYWQYAPGAWAEANASSRAVELTLAESVRRASIAVLVPADPSDTLDGQYTNVLAAAPSPAGGSLEIATPGARNGGYYLAWGTSAGRPDVQAAAPHDVTINGHVWTIRDGMEPEADLRGSDVPIQITLYYGRSVAELKRVLDGLKIAPNLTDRGTWFDARTALR